MAEQHLKGEASFEDANGVDVATKYSGTDWINDGLEILSDGVTGHNAFTDQGVIFTDLTALDTNIGGGTSLSDDQYAEVVVLSVAAFGIGAVVRASSSPDNGYVGMIGSTTSTLELFRFDAGFFTSLGTFTLGSPVVTNDVIGVEAEGSTIRLIHEGTTRVSVTDATYASGSPGVYSFQDGGPYGDVFTCGDLSHWPETHKIRQSDRRALARLEARRAARRRIAIMGGLS